MPIGSAPLCPATHVRILAMTGANTFDSIAGQINKQHFAIEKCTDKLVSIFKLKMRAHPTPNTH